MKRIVYVGIAYYFAVCWTTGIIASHNPYVGYAMYFIGTLLSIILGFSVAVWKTIKNKNFTLKSFWRQFFHLKKFVYLVPLLLLIITSPFPTLFLSDHIYQIPGDIYESYFSNIIQINPEGNFELILSYIWDMFSIHCFLLYIVSYLYTCFLIKKAFNSTKSPV